MDPKISVFQRGKPFCKKNLLDLVPFLASWAKSFLTWEVPEVPTGTAKYSKGRDGSLRRRWAIPKLACSNTCQYEAQIRKSIVDPDVKAQVPI